jgi:hypothetical protein
VFVNVVSRWTLSRVLWLQRVNSPFFLDLCVIIIFLGVKIKLEFVLKLTLCIKTQVSRLCLVLVLLLLIPKEKFN